MTDLPLVAGKLKEQCKMLRFHIFVLHDDTIGIFGLVHDICKKALRNQCQLEVAGIAVVVADHVIYGIIRIERVVIALCIKREGDCAGHRHRLCKGDRTVLSKCSNSIVAVLQAEFDLILLVSHSRLSSYNLCLV